MTEQEYNRLYYKAYHLPSQLERARAKVKRLEAEAIRLGMRELIRGDTR